jgi:hypothetical protein
MTPRAAFDVTPLKGGTPLDRRSRIFGCSGFGALRSGKRIRGSAVRSQRFVRRDEGRLT